MNSLDKESRREGQEFKRQMAEDAAEEIELIKFRLWEHEQKIAAMPPVVTPTKKNAKDMSIREFLDELQRRHPWLVIRRKGRTK